MSVAGRSIELWVEARDGRPAVNPVLRAVLRRLEQDGARTIVRVPEQEVLEPSELAADLVLLKSATSLALSTALGASRRLRFLNDAAATVRAHDKAAALAALAAAGLPVPETQLVELGTRAEHAATAADGAWIAKPVRGVHGHGVVPVPSYADAIASLGAATPPPSIADDGARLVQRRVGGGADLKVYVAGARIFAVRKEFGPRSFETDEVADIDLGHDLHAIVRAAGAALSLTLYGVDLRLDGRDAVIVDVNPFPGYRGLPAAAPALRREIEKAVTER
jgi:ribosomal protein S6--L-glutamate ligase